MKRSEKKAEYVPCAVALKIASDIPEYNRPAEWMVGEDCSVKFVDRLIEIIYDWGKPILNSETILAIYRAVFFSDTDSFLFKVRTENFNADLERMKDRYFHTSNV